MLSKIRIYKIGILVSSLLLITGCNKIWDDHYSTLDENAIKEKIIAELENIDEISLFTAAVKANDELLDILGQNRLFTVFAPVDNAFSQVDASITGNSDLLDRMIKYHFIDGKYKYKDFEAADILAFNEKYLNIAVGETDGEVIVGKIASITDPDYLSLNGMIQVIDEPLIPLNNLYEHFLYNEHLVKFAESIQKYTTKEFNIGASTPSSINEQGEIVYDSAFTYLNPFLYTGEGWKWETFYDTDVLYQNIVDEDLDFSVVLPGDFETAISALESNAFLFGPLADQDLAGPLLANLIFSGKLTKEEIIAEIQTSHNLPGADSSELQLYVADLLQNNYEKELELSNGTAHEVNSFEYDLSWLITDQANMDKYQSETDYREELISRITTSDNVDTVYVSSNNVMTVFYFDDNQLGYEERYGEWVDFELEDDFYPVDYRVMVRGRIAYSGTFKVEIEGQEINQFDFSTAPSGDLDNQFDEIGIVRFSEAKKKTNLKFTFVETHDDDDTGEQYLWIREIKLEPILK